MKPTRFIVRPLAREESGIGDDIEDPVLAKMLLELGYNLASELRPFGWDQPPALLLLRVLNQVKTEGAVGMYMQVDPLPGFEQLTSRYFEQTGRMHHAVLHAADSWERLVAMPKFQSLDVSTLAAVAWSTRAGCSRRPRTDWRRWRRSCRPARCTSTPSASRCA